MTINDVSLKLSHKERVIFLNFWFSMATRGFFVVILHIWKNICKNRNLFIIIKEEFKMYFCNFYNMLNQKM
jgi:hypothetical protein